MRAWVNAALSIEKVELLPLSPEVAVLSTELSLHGDPADRIIVATAHVVGGQLITKDDRIRQSGLVPCTW